MELNSMPQIHAVSDICQFASYEETRSLITNGDTDAIIEGFMESGDQGKYVRDMIREMLNDWDTLLNPAYVVDVILNIAGVGA